MILRQDRCWKFLLSIRNFFLLLPYASLYDQAVIGGVRYSVGSSRLVIIAACNFLLHMSCLELASSATMTWSCCI